MQIHSVYSVEPPPTPRPLTSAVNASLVFLTRSLCLFGDSCGGVALLDTTAGGSWQLLEHLPPGDGLGGGAFSILAGRLNHGGRQLDFVSVELGDAPSPMVCDGRGVPPTCILRWHRVKFCEDVSSLEQRERSPQGGLVETSTVCCTLQSQAVPLHCDFFEGTAVMVNEAAITRIDPVRLGPPGQDSTEHSDVEDSEGGRRKRDQEHAGLGYCTEADGGGGEERGGEVAGGSCQLQTPKRKRLSEETEEAGKFMEGRTEEGVPQRAGLSVASSRKPYEWSQSDSDATITLQLPRDVKKQELCCSIKPREIVLGLNDGTTLLRGVLHAPVDPEASTWSIEQHR